MNATKVIIDRDGVWVGEGRWTEDYEIVDCPAVLGPDQDASDETYAELCEALAWSGAVTGRHRGPVSVTRPDGVYSAVLD